MSDWSEVRPQVEFCGLQAIADYMGISLPKLKKKHVKNMLLCQAINTRNVRRKEVRGPAREEYFAWENRVQAYVCNWNRKYGAL